MALHSRYNPQAEASRFVDALSVLYPPDYIVITEPGESYLARYLGNVSRMQYLLLFGTQTRFLYQLMDFGIMYIERQAVRSSVFY